jgi:hypothetical protein
MGKAELLVRASLNQIAKKKKKSVTLILERTIPTERPPLVGEVSANFLRIDGVTWSA